MAMRRVRDREPAMSPADADDLLQRAAKGDPQAVQHLLEQHRDRLRRMVGVRMSPLLAARFDPSDVVQDALAIAARKLPEYARRPNCPFYPWLRQIAWERLVVLHRRHVHAKRRSVSREERMSMPLSDASEIVLARQFLSHSTSPSNHLLRKEEQQRVHDALERLSNSDREVLVLRHLEQLPMQEVAIVLKLSESATQSRYRRAVERLHALLSEGS
jgi:RNA polymerase sigma-70 factor, ECF subfamily